MPGLPLLWVLFQKLLFLQGIWSQCSGLYDIILYMWLFWWVGPILSCFYFHLLLKGNCFILQRAINELEEHAPDTCDECVMKEWRHWGGWPLWGWRSGPMVVEGDGKKWDSLYEISLGNPSDARPHYDCGHGIKAHLLLSFLFLLAALKQKIWAVTSSPPNPPTSVLRECRWHREAKSFSGLQFLARTTGRACQVARIRVSVCVACA